MAVTEKRLEQTGYGPNSGPDFVVTSQRFPELMAGKERTGMGRTMIVDLGSTNMKLAMWNPSDCLAIPDDHTDNPNLVRKVHLKDKTDQMQLTGLTPFKYVDYDRVLPLINRHIGELEEANGEAENYVVTGFTNNLAVTLVKRDDNGVKTRGKTYILLDEPSAVTDLTAQQKELMRSHSPDPEGFDRDGLKRASSLMKVAFIINHPEAIQALFGDEVKIDDLEFSTMQGLVARDIVNRQDPNFMLGNTVPAGGDTRSFGGGNIEGASREATIDLILKMGLRPDQIVFETSPVITFFANRREEKKMLLIQDNEANLLLMHHLMETYQIPATAFTFEGDSVWKLAIKDGKDKLPGLKRINGMRYMAQRMGGNATEDWGQKIANHMQYFGMDNYGFDFYIYLAKIIREKENDQSTNFFYYPDIGDRGVLVDADGAEVNPYGGKYDKQQLRDMIWVIQRDALFGIREKQDRIRHAKGIPVDETLTVIHGGLTKNRPAVDLAAQILPGNVAVLRNASFAGQAAFLRAMTLQGHSIDSFGVSLVDVPSSFKRDLEYEKWQEVGEKVKSMLPNIPPRAQVYPSSVIPL